jgi:hypothetical protein
MYLNIVTNTTILNKIKTIPYFKTDLGSSFRRKEKRGGPTRVAFENPFAENYYKKHGRLLMKSGKIGIINVYTDYGISNNSIHIYNDGDLFDFDFNNNDYKTTGSMEKYLGALLKKIEKDHKVALPKVTADNEGEDKKVPKKKHSDPAKIIQDPGRVSWDDLQDYLSARKNN